MGNKKTQTTETDMGPWSGQQPYIKQAFSEAQNLYNTSQSNPYTGDMIAQAPAGQYDMAGSAKDWYRETGRSVGQSIMNLGQGLAANGTTGLNNVTNDLMDFSRADRVGMVIDAAGRVSNNPYMSGMVDSAMADARRNAGENVLPSIYRNAADTGNINSSKTAISEGVLHRGLADKAADISADMRGRAYSQGLTIGQNDLQMKLASLNDAGGRYAGMLGTGMAGMGAGYGMVDESNKGALAMGEYQQNLGQQKIDNELAKRQYQWNDLNNYYGLVGKSNWGTSGKTTQTMKEEPGAAAIAGGVLGAAGSLFGGGGMFGASGAFGGLAKSFFK